MYSRKNLQLIALYSTYRTSIITAQGEKFFCAGWDLKAAAGGEEVDGDYGVGGFGGIQELPNLNKPIIAAVNGIACGGGLELAMSADIIISSDHSTFALPEILSGTVADAASVKLMGCCGSFCFICFSSFYCNQGDFLFFCLF